MKPLCVKLLNILAGAALLVGLVQAPARAARFDVPSDNYPTIQSAVDAAAAAGNGAHFINLRVSRFQITEALNLSGFNADRTLTVRPDPRIAALRRATIASVVGHVSIVNVGGGFVTLQDLDLIRHVTNEEHLIVISSGRDIVIERCRIGSDWPTPGTPGKAALRVTRPERVVVRNCIVFARAPGTLDDGIVVSVETGNGRSIYLYNNTVADYRRRGIAIEATEDTLLVLRNNVVANHVSLEPEPVACSSDVPATAKVVSSHNAVFAGAGQVETKAGALPVFDTEALLQVARGQVMDAFLKTRWFADPLNHPNRNFFRLRNRGPLHETDRDAGQPVGPAAPLAEDIAVNDDWQHDLRPSDDPLRTDRGADQWRPVTAEDVEISEARLAPWHGLTMRGGGFGIVAVGPQTEPPPFIGDEEAMSGGGFRLGGAFISLGGSLHGPGRLELEPRPQAGGLLLSWRENGHTAYDLEETPAIAGDSVQWTPVSAEPAWVNGRRVITLGVGPSCRYYRLRKP